MDESGTAELIRQLATAVATCGSNFNVLRLPFSWRQNFQRHNFPESTNSQLLSYYSFDRQLMDEK